MTPAGASARDAAAGPRCPFCGSTDTELLSLFGSQLLTDQRYCRACHTPFEHISKDDEGDTAAAPDTHEQRAQAGGDA
jgi:hypothetical protein